MSRTGIRYGARLHYDFANGIYEGSPLCFGQATTALQRMNSIMTETNNSVAANTMYAPNDSGVYIPCTNISTLRITQGKGLWIENSGGNYLLQCRDATNAAWTKSASMTASHTNIPGADGKSSGAFRLTAGAANQTCIQNNIGFPLMGGDGISVNNGGTSGTYVVGNNLTLVGGTFTTAAQAQVKTVSAGQVLTFQAFPKVVGLYTVRPTFPAATTGGGGSGCTLTFNDTYIFSALVKRNTGTGTISITMDGGTSYTDITSQINSSSYTLVYITSTNPNSISCGFKISTSGDVIDVDMCQLEGALQGIHYPTTRVVTTSAAIIRGVITGSASSGEEAFFNNPSVAAGFNNGWTLVQDIFQARPVSAVIIAEGYGASGCLNIGTDVGFFFTGGCDGNAISLKNGNTGSVTSTSSNTGNFGGLNKMGFSLGGGKAILGLNGVLTTDTSNHFSTQTGLTHGGVGNRGAGDLPLNGCIREMWIFDYDIDAGTLLNLVS